MTPDEMADFEENVIHGDDRARSHDQLNISAGDGDQLTTSAGDAGDRLTQSGRMRLMDVLEGTGKSGTPARRRGKAI